MASQITVNSGSGNITVTTSRAVIGTVANVASANYANFAGEAFDVSGGNVTGAVANATFATTAGSANTANSATVANSANSVAGANVTGAVANATFATNAGSATTAGSATIAGTVTTAAQPNITSVGNLTNLTVTNTTTTGNLVVLGNLQVGNLVANSANYANFAGNAFSVDGSNVVGAVANATFALDAGNANIANIAYSVDAANVSGLGNIATINLDGNVSNLLTGNGTFVAIPTGGGSNFANFAGEVTTSAQPNITSTGNLTSFTVNDGINGNTLQFNPAGITVGNVIYAEVQYSNTLSARDAYVLGNTIGNPFHLKDWISGDGNTILSLPSATMTVSAGTAGVGNLAAPGEFTFSYYTNDSNLTSGATNTKTSFSAGQSLNFTTSMPISSNVGTMQTFTYGLTADPASSTLLRSTRRRGNSGTRLSLEPNDYLGNIEWRGSRGGGSLPTGSRFAKIAPRVDSSYVANTAAQPVGIEFWVTDNTTARSQVFHANGNVTFANAVNANIMTANYLYGDGSNITGISGGSASGNTTEIQFNNAGAFAASNAFTFNTSGNSLTLGTSSQIQLNSDIRQLALNGIGEQPPANGVYSQLIVNNGAVVVSQDNIGGGLASFTFNQYENTTAFLNPYTFYRARGNATSPQAVANGDAVMSQSFNVYGDSGNTYVSIGNFGAFVNTNDGAGNVSGTIVIGTANNNDGSSVQLYSDIINLDGNVTTQNDINVNSGNVIIGANGNVQGNIVTANYLYGDGSNISNINPSNVTRTYGDFYSNVSQTNPNIANVNLMTFNNTGIADGISIVSNSQMTIARAGNYNIQFSAQLSQTSGGSEEAYIWLRKNGSDVPYTAGETVIAGNGDKIMAAWNYLVTANVNDYFELAWNATDTSVILESVAPAGIIPGIASVIATVTPVGA